MSQRAARLFIPAFLAFYFLFAFVRWATFQPEIYPVSAWGMFQRIPKTYTDYDILIHGITGHEQQSPLLLSDPENGTGTVLDAHVRLVINGYVQFTKRDDEEKADHYRAFIEQHVLGSGVRYEILEKRMRTRVSEKHLEQVVRYGPFETSPGIDVDRTERFVFKRSRLKFAKRAKRLSWPEKKRKSAK